jgi:hypothetical protein
MKTLQITPKDGINARAHRKENNFLESYKLVAIYKSELVEIADLRIYGTNAKNYSCLWVHDKKNNIYCSGSGSAGGYGYHRPSAASSEAFQTAGIELSESISGRGDRAQEEALLSLAKKLGYRKTYVIKGHG